MHIHHFPERKRQQHCVFTHVARGWSNHHDDRCRRRSSPLTPSEGTSGCYIRNPVCTVVRTETGAKRRDRLLDRRCHGSALDRDTSTNRHWTRARGPEHARHGDRIPHRPSSGRRLAERLVGALRRGSRLRAPTRNEVHAVEFGREVIAQSQRGASCCRSTTRRASAGCPAGITSLSLA